MRRYKFAFSSLCRVLGSGADHQYLGTGTCRSISVARRSTAEGGLGNLDDGIINNCRPPSGRHEILAPTSMIHKRNVERVIHRKAGQCEGRSEFYCSLDEFPDAKKGDGCPRSGRWPSDCASDANVGEGGRINGLFAVSSSPTLGSASDLRATEPLAMLGTSGANSAWCRSVSSVNPIEGTVTRCDLGEPVLGDPADDVDCERDRKSVV